MKKFTGSLNFLVFNLSILCPDYEKPNFNPSLLEVQILIPAYQNLKIFGPVHQISKF